MNCRIFRYQNLILREKLAEKMTKNLKYDQTVMILKHFWCRIPLNQMMENLKFSQKIPFLEKISKIPFSERIYSHWASQKSRFR